MGLGHVKRTMSEGRRGRQTRHGLPVLAVPVFEPVLAKRFVRVRRDFVTEGHWARLCGRDPDGGGCTSAPVMNLLACGYDDGAVCVVNRLAALSGVAKCALQSARRPLQAAGAVGFLPSPRRGVWRF